MGRKKILALILSMACVFSAVPCIAGADEAETEAVGTEAAETESAESETAETEGTETEASETEAAVTDDTAAEKSEGVMTYEEYMAAEMGTEVVIEAYVQAKQERTDDAATIYAQDEDGGYLIYRAECTGDLYESLEEGVKIKVTGIKSGLEEASEADAEDAEAETEEAEASEAETEEETSSVAIRITDAVIEVEEGSYIAEALDVTELLGTDELSEHQNEYVSFSAMTIEAFDDGMVYHYGKDGSGEDGDDLYFNVSLNGETYTFVVVAALYDNTSVVYNLVRLLEAGDVVDMEGFLCWEETVTPHITYMQFSA